jgi:hypothetical protein
MPCRFNDWISAKCYSRSQKEEKKANYLLRFGPVPLANAEPAVPAAGPPRGKCEEEKPVLPPLPLLLALERPAPPVDDEAEP